jgi:ATP-dependent DNA helicase RecG
LAHSLKISEEILNKYISFFPYDLTTDQNKCLNEVKKDLAKDEPMMRMVQGDVGCGKTSIAFLAAAITIENHFQTALMCPTEALALQHFLSAEEFFHNTPVRIGLLLGSTSAKEKKIINKKLVDGEIDLIIGTHSLFQESVQFKSLALAIIDEQHKFGVEQRISLINKGQGTHCLIMSATPIPRSLSLTRYGDLDISIIRSMPAGRKGHKTRIVTPDTFSQYLSFIKTRLSMKEQVYIVVPAINESVEQEIHHLESALESYKKYFPEFRIKGLHGQMKSDEKQSIFKEFKNHEFDLLVSTSVIEVGINVPNATIMSILNPERFGLSSLHQLRGRVGRGDKTGFCFLVTDKQLATTSQERLKVIENHTDGFLIAEEDLKLRGEGDLFGKEQSGSQQRKLANLILHSDLLEDARVDLEEALKKNDPIIEAQIAKISKDAKIFNTI